MADDASPIGQDEVEKLLAQAREGTAPASPPPPAPAQDAGAALDQSEIEALFQQSAGGPPKSAAAPPKSTPPPVSAAAKSAESNLNRAQQALASVDTPAAELPPGMKPFEFRSLSGRPPNTDSATLDLLRDVQLDLKIELGRTHMQLEEVLQLKTGAVVTLDKLAGDPVDIFVNGRLIARGEVLVMNDNFCVRVAELFAGESALTTELRCWRRYRKPPAAGGKKRVALADRGSIFYKPFPGWRPFQLVSRRRRNSHLPNLSESTRTMFVLRSLLRLRALACCAAFAATHALADETTAPAAFPVWPDQAQSVYAQRTAVPTDEPPAPPIQPVIPAKFEAPAAIPQIAAPSPNDPRRLAPPRARRLSRTAKHPLADAEPKLLPSFGVPFESLYTTGAALAVVLGLFLLFAALVRRSAKKTNLVLPEEVVSVLGRVPLAARQFAELVRVGNKLVLISVTQAGAEPLTEITDPVEIDRLVGLCRSRTKGSSTDEFDQIFRQLSDESAPTGFLGHEVPRVDAPLAAPADVYAAYRGGAQRA